MKTNSSAAARPSATHALPARKRALVRSAFPIVGTLTLLFFQSLEPAAGAEAKPGADVPRVRGAERTAPADVVAGAAAAETNAVPTNVVAAAKEPEVVGSEIRDIAELNRAGFPVIDYHAHLKGGLTMEQLLEHSRATGIRYGVAVNCGIGFTVTNDAGIVAWLAETKDAPVFHAMQAEGREWVHTFSPDAIAKFDYVFTDAMTFTGANGKRMRLWLTNEVEIADAQSFMEEYVAKITTILDTEPIDIYVNATFLPEIIVQDYDKLWTPERMDRVIAAAVKNGVAIEINSRYCIPSATFIKRAKAAGAKFTFGTNNTGPDLGRLEYSLQMQRECGLTAADMFAPKPDGKKPIQTRGFGAAK